jgi:hypothetical protein
MMLALALFTSAGVVVPLFVRELVAAVVADEPI